MFRSIQIFLVMAMMAASGVASDSAPPFKAKIRDRILKVKKVKMEPVYDRAHMTESIQKNSYGKKPLYAKRKKFVVRRGEKNFGSWSTGPRARKAQRVATRR